MIKRILVVLADPSHDGRALRLGLDLAVRHGAALTILLVCGPPPQESGCILRLSPAAELAERRQRFADCCQPVFMEYPALIARPRVLVAAGFLMVEAVKVARSQDADILLIDSDNSEASCERELSGRTGIVALGLSAGASCPVCVVPPQMTERTGPFERVLVAVDLSSDPAPLRGLLNYAARLAVREGAELHVLHAQPHLANQYAQILSEAARSIANGRERLADLCRGLPGADRIAFVVSQGTAGLEILKSATECKADLLIVDRRGNDAGEKLACVLEGAQCPLLLLKPGAQTYMQSF